jgi:lipopolysaccharide transport system ATP-binding protein
MNDIAIRVEHISKQYRIGGKKASYKTLREALIQKTNIPLRWLKGERQKKNTFWALEDVSFEINHGEVVGIIGRNGAGKSTLLKILSSITYPTRGRVELYGRVGSLLEVGTGFHPELTGQENIFLNGAILGMSHKEIQRKFDEIVDFAGIEKFLNTPVKFYSSGMYVRLAFAVAAHLETEILLVDEVLAVGDAEFQKKSLGKMGDVAQSGRTVLFVSHQLDMIKALCETTILLNQGKLIKFGESKDTIDTYVDKIRNDNIAESFNVKDDKNIIIQVTRGKVCRENGETNHTFDMFEKIYVMIDFIVRKPIVGANLQLEFKNSSGTILFWSFDTDRNEDLLYRPREIGTFRSRVELPYALFKPGLYYISIYTGITNSERIQSLEDILEFNIELVSKGSAYLSYAKKRPGLIASNLKWQTKKTIIY